MYYSPEVDPRSRRDRYMFKTYANENAQDTHKSHTRENEIT